MSILSEALRKMAEHGITTDDVTWCGSTPNHIGDPANRDWWTNKWEEFAAWAAAEDGCWSPLVLMLRNGKWLAWYDQFDDGLGGEWSLCGPPVPPIEKLPFPIKPSESPTI
jgi:hypothetical protein